MADNYAYLRSRPDQTRAILRAHRSLSAAHRLLLVRNSHDETGMPTTLEAEWSTVRAREDARNARIRNHVARQYERYARRTRERQLVADARAHATPVNPRMPLHW